MRAGREAAREVAGVARPPARGERFRASDAGAARGPCGLAAAVVAVLVSWGAAHAAAAPPPVSVEVDDLRLTHVGELRVTLASRDGRAHAVELHVTHDLGGLRPLPARVEIPATGVVHATVRVFRGDAAWASRHEVDVVALDRETPLGLSSAVIDVTPDPALVPRLRGALIALGLLLLAAAVATEWRRETAA